MVLSHHFLKDSAKKLPLRCFSTQPNIILFGLRHEFPTFFLRVIYSIPCKDCDKLYIGETKRKFHTRLREHQKAVEQEHPKKSAHSLQSGHTISWESSIILCTSPGWRTRRLLEAWEINKCKSPLNREDGMYLPQEYRALALLDKNLFCNIFCFLLAPTRF